MTNPRPGDTPVAYKDLTPLGPTAPVYKCIHEWVHGICKKCSVGIFAVWKAEIIQKDSQRV